jgi:hypothetical protein
VVRGADDAHGAGDEDGARETLEGAEDEEHDCVFGEAADDGRCEVCIRPAEEYFAAAVEVGDTARCEEKTSICDATG